MNDAEYKVHVRNAAKERMRAMRRRQQLQKATAASGLPATDTKPFECAAYKVSSNMLTYSPNQERLRYLFLPRCGMSNGNWRDAEMHRLAKLEFVSHPDQAEVSGISPQWRYDRALNR